MEVTLQTGYRAPFDASTQRHGASRAATAADSAIQAIDAVDVVLDLSSGARDLLGVVYGLPKESLEEFLKLSAALLEQGIVGTETLEVQGEPYKSFVSARMANSHLRDAPIYREGPEIATPAVEFFA